MPDTITLKRPVAFIAIVTEKFRQELQAELRAAADQIQQQVDGLEFQSKRLISDLQRTNLSQAMAARDQVERETQKQLKIKEEILRKADEVAKLEDDAEYPRGTLEGLTEVRTGDDLKQVLAGAAIVVKDDVVVEIREQLGVVETIESKGDG